jgi:hypothetical protein
VTHNPTAATTAPTPPAFPELLKRMFPTLRAEETNMLFQAFRERRLRRRKGRIGGWFPSISIGKKMAVIIVLGAFAYALIMSIPVWNSGVFYAFSFAPMVALVSDMILAHRFKKHKPSTLPYYLHEVFGEVTSADSAALDLWLAGVMAREVIEVMYLELFSTSWRPVSLAFAVGVIVVPALLLREAESFGLSHFLMVGSVALAGVLGWKLTLLLLLRRALRSTLDAGWLRWHRPYFERHDVWVVVPKESKPRGAFRHLKELLLDIARFASLIAGIVLLLGHCFRSSRGLPRSYARDPKSFYGIELTLASSDRVLSSARNCGD